MSVRALARRYKVGTDSLYRHSNNHLPPQLRASLIAGPDLDIDLDKLRETESQSLLANLVALRQRLFSSLDVAEEAGDGNMLSRLAGQLHNNLEITGKLLGDLGTGSTTINNVLVMPAYVEMRVELVRAWRRSLTQGGPSPRCCIRSSTRRQRPYAPTRGSWPHDGPGPRTRARSMPHRS